MTIGTKIIKMEKILNYLLEDILYKKYLRELDGKSDSITTYFANPDEWKEFKKEKLKEIFK